MKNLQDDRRIRLLNRLYAKKRKALAEQKAKLRQAQSSQMGDAEQLQGTDAMLEGAQLAMSASMPAPALCDDRSVEELLNFIGGPDDRCRIGLHMSISPVLSLAQSPVHAKMSSSACSNPSMARCTSRPRSRHALRHTMQRATRSFCQITALG